MISYTSSTLAASLNSFHTLVLDSAIRSRLYSILNENKGDSLLCILLTPYEVISISKSELITIVSHDIILIQNLIFSSESLKNVESLVPICLPGISDSGYLQLYCKFIEPFLGLVLITESQELSVFLKFTEQSQIILDSLENEKLIQPIKIAIEQKLKPKKDLNQDSLFEDLIFKLSIKRESILNFNIDPISISKYLICKNRNSNQIFSINFNDFDKINNEERIVMRNYLKLYDICYCNNTYINTQNFFHYEKNQGYTHVIQCNESFILFVSFDLFKEFIDINNLSTEILKIIKNKESNFFINKY